MGISMRRVLKAVVAITFVFLTGYVAALNFPQIGRGDQSLRVAAYYSIVIVLVIISPIIRRVWQWYFLGLILCVMVEVLFCKLTFAHALYFSLRVPKWVIFVLMARISVLNLNRTTKGKCEIL